MINMKVLELVKKFWRDRFCKEQVTTSQEPSEKLKDRNGRFGDMLPQIIR